jgi:hypothetical protein
MTKQPFAHASIHVELVPTIVGFANLVAVAKVLETDGATPTAVRIVGSPVGGARFCCV